MPSGSTPVQFWQTGSSFCHWPLQTLETQVSRSEPIAWARQALFSDQQVVSKISVCMEFFLLSEDSKVLWFSARQCCDSFVHCDQIAVLYQYIIVYHSISYRLEVLCRDLKSSLKTILSTFRLTHVQEFFGFVLCWFYGGNSSWCERLFSPTLCRTGWGLRQKLAHSLEPGPLGSH